LNFAPLRIRFQVFLFDLVGPIRIVQKITHKSNGLAFSGLKLFARELLNARKCGTEWN
jgi:hypothetical protein